jgi:hypothetical protein
MSRLGCVQAQKRSVIGARALLFFGLASHHFSLGPTDMEGPGRVRATALIEDIWCEKIRGCSYRGGNTSA